MAPEADSVVRVCSKSEVTPGSVKAFAVGDKTLAVYNIDGSTSCKADDCLWVQVPSGQSRSGQIGIEFLRASW